MCCSQNMRVSGAKEQDHADWLIKLGNGELNIHPQLGPNAVEIPNHFIISEKAMISHVFGAPGSFNRPNFAENVCNRAILCPKNKDCLELNNCIISCIPGEQRTFKSIDSIDSQDPDEISNFPPEYLNTVYISGMPPHVLTLKIGIIIILLKKVDSRQQLCNGT